VIGKSGSALKAKLSGLLTKRAVNLAKQVEDKGTISGDKDNYERSRL
jgi:hypothetical protein